MSIEHILGRKPVSGFTLSEDYLEHLGLGAGNFPEVTVQKRTVGRYVLLFAGFFSLLNLCLIGTTSAVLRPVTLTAMSAIPIRRTLSEVNFSASLLKLDIIHESSHQVDATAMRRVDVRDVGRIC